MEMGTLIFDIDGTICSQESDYSQAKPIQEVIDKLTFIKEKIEARIFDYNDDFD